MADPVLTERRENVLLITLNRPEARNAVNRVTAEGIAAALDELDGEDGWVAVEIKRIGTIDAVEQLTRYLERIHVDPALADCRGVVAAQAIKPQARTLAEARGIACVEVDLEVLRGEREADLTLFA